MKLVSYKVGCSCRLGLLLDKKVVDLACARRDLSMEGQFHIGYLPSDIVEFLSLGDAALQDARIVASLVDLKKECEGIVDADKVGIVAPVPKPTSMRDGYAFRQHVESARRNRGLEMIPEFDEIPIFYFTNHNAVTGPGFVDVQDMHLQQLDFELECAVVIGREGRNIKVDEADSYIFGYMVMNDWSARAMQMHEMKLNLGPAKGKDFATSIGPWLVTKDELSHKRIAKPTGDAYDLSMITRVNGTEVSRGNVKDMSWTFAQIIARASYGVTLYPGDVIGSGTCGTGCLLELNGSKVFNPPMWLKDGDVVECEIEMLGSLSNTVRRVAE